MIFENELLSLNILDVLKLNQKNINMRNTRRNFDALSFRLRTDACLQTEENVYHLENNSICFVPAGLDYKRFATADELIVVHFNAANYVNKEIELFKPEAPERFSELFRSVLMCWNAKKTGYKYRCTAMLYEIFAECYAQNAKYHTNNSRIKNSITYISENYKKSDLSINEIAKRSFMSEVYFRKIFKSEFGISPKKYIVKLRIQNAIALITTGYYSLKEVAFMSGYTDYKYFSVEFKRIKGVSPSEYLYNYHK